MSEAQCQLQISVTSLKSVLNMNISHGGLIWEPKYHDLEEYPGICQIWHNEAKFSAEKGINCYKVYKDPVIQNVFELVCSFGRIKIFLLHIF